MNYILKISFHCKKGNNELKAPATQTFVFSCSLLSSFELFDLGQETICWWFMKNIFVGS